MTEIEPRFVPRSPGHPREPPSGWVKVDFHMHTYGSGDAVTTVDEFGTAVEAAGLDVVCVTDHNTIHVAESLVRVLDVRVVVGQEIKTHTGELIGLFLRDRVSFGLPAAEAAHRIRDQGGLVYVPHPIGPRANAMSVAGMLDLLDAHLLDAVEVFNSRNTSEAANKHAAAFATERGLVGGAGSDAHYPDEIGAAFLVMPDFDSPAQFLESMAGGWVVGRRHDPGRSTWQPRIIPSHEPG